MLPIVKIPDTIGRCLAPYRSVFCREAGFEHISRYVSGLILSPNKTLQGIYDLQVWVDDSAPSRRAMHEAVFEAGWASEALMPRHREVVSADHRGRGREVISLDWTFAHHERGVHIWGVSSAWDYKQNPRNLRRNRIVPIRKSSTSSAIEKPSHDRPGATSCALLAATLPLMPCPPWTPL